MGPPRAADILRDSLCRGADRVTKTIEIEFKTKEDFFKAYSENIGGGGLFVRGQQLLAVGTEVSLKFNLPGDNVPIKTLSNVVWLKEEPEKSMGVQFINVNPKDGNRIKAFVEKNLPD